MRAPLVVSLLGALTLSACGPTVDLTKGLQVLDVSTGWKDVGVQDDGMNKLVPALTFKLKNMSDQPLRTLQVNAVNLLNTVEWATIDTNLNSRTFGQVLSVRPMRTITVDARFRF